MIIGSGQLGSMTRLPQQQVHHAFKWTAPTVISQSLLDTFGSFSYKMSDLTETASFAALFQQYRLVGVQVFFRPMFRATSIVDDTTVLMPLIATAMDPNDITAWTAFTQARNSENVHITDDSAGFSIQFTPQPAFAAFAGGVFNGFAQMAVSPWLDTTYNAIEHYGLRWAITGNGLASNYQSWMVETREHFEFRLGK